MYLWTLGCPKNEVDSRELAHLLVNRGVAIATDAADAAVIVINTCGFIQEAKEESLEAILDAAREWPGVPVVAIGCLVERYRDDLRREIPEVSAWFGVDEREAAAEYVGNIALAAAAVEGRSRVTHSGAGMPRLPGAWGYVKVSDGCDHHCSFCAIPLIKGRYRAEPLRAVLAQAEDLLAAGARELVLIGQDTALWREGTYRLADLVERLADDTRVARVRLMYLQPEHVDERLLQVMADHPRVCRYLDMPFQHASAAVLRRMRRWGDACAYKELIQRARALMPSVSLRSTFIVGFPGERDEDFEELLDFVVETGFDHAGAFVFSPEEGTEAATLTPRVPVRTARRRLSRLSAALLDAAEARLQARVGEMVDVLVDGPAADDAPSGAVAVGRTEGQAPEVDGVSYLTGERAEAFVVGEVVRGRVVETVGYDLVVDPV